MVNMVCVGMVNIVWYGEYGMYYVERMVQAWLPGTQ